MAEPEHRNARCRGPAGVCERSGRIGGPPGTWEILPFPSVKETGGTGERAQQARRDKRQEVGASRSTGEAGEPSQRDPVEGRGGRRTEPKKGKTEGTLGPESVSTRLQRIAKQAEEAPGMVVTTLAHHVDRELLREAYRLTRKDGAVGVDHQTAQEYAANLEGNLASLHERLKAGTYVAPPVKRVHIPKGDGSKTRPIGIPTFEDKVLQRAVAMVLEAVYEQDFLDCSFGFRPQRSAHDALHLLRERAMRTGAVVLEVDIQAFFDSLDHAHLRGFLDLRVRDGVIRRVIDKWLKAGVLEEGSVSLIANHERSFSLASGSLPTITTATGFMRLFHARMRAAPVSGPCVCERRCARKCHRTKVPWRKREEIDWSHSVVPASRRAALAIPKPAQV